MEHTQSTERVVSFDGSLKHPGKEAFVATSSRVKPSARLKLTQRRKRLNQTCRTWVGEECVVFSLSCCWCAADAAASAAAPRPHKLHLLRFHCASLSPSVTAIAAVTTQARTTTAAASACRGQRRRQLHCLSDAIIGHCHRVLLLLLLLLQQCVEKDVQDLLYDNIGEDRLDFSKTEDIEAWWHMRRCLLGHQKFEIFGFPVTSNQ